MQTWNICLKKCTRVKVILKSYTEKKSKHTPSDYSLFTNCSFDETKNKLNYCRGKDCMEKFYKDLREYAMRIVNYEKKGMIALTDEETKFYKVSKFLKSLQHM